MNVISIVKILIINLIGFLLGVWFWNWDNVEPCPNPRTAGHLERPECFFSPNYETARIRFTEEAKRANAQFHSLHLPCGYYIDIAIVKGRSHEKLLLHIAGTHGVEGFAGSAIQIASLRMLAKRNTSEPLDRTVMFVHVLNPYGMANFRRVNENNVDLNRNAHFEESSLQQMLERPSNVAGYDDWYDVLNPSYPPSVSKDLLNYATGFLSVLRTSFAQFKRAIVTGTYTHNRGIFFGGRTLQDSHRVVRDFLSQEAYLTTITDLIVVDVHTGLGPMARDTLMMNDNIERARQLFSVEPRGFDIPWIPPYALEIQTMPIGKSQNVASEGYDLVTGDVQAGYPKLFKNLEHQVSVTQEFGTYSPGVVALALITENQSFHFGSPRQHARSAARLKETFCPASQSFVGPVVQRGLLLVAQSLVN